MTSQQFLDLCFKHNLKLDEYKSISQFSSLYQPTWPVVLFDDDMVFSRMDLLTNSDGEIDPQNVLISNISIVVEYTASPHGTGNGVVIHELKTKKVDILTYTEDEFEKDLNHCIESYNKAKEKKTKYKIQRICRELED